MSFESRLIHLAMLCGKRILYNNSLWRNKLLLYYSTLFKNGLWKLPSIIKWKKMRREEKVQQRCLHSKGSRFWCPVRAMQNWSWVLHFIWQSDPQKPPLQYISRLCWGEMQRERMSSGRLTWSHTGEPDGNSTQLLLSEPSALNLPLGCNAKGKGWVYWMTQVCVKKVLEGQFWSLVHHIRRKQKFWTLCLVC